MKVYLAGNITGLMFSEASSWRDLANDMLEDIGVTAADPMRDICMEDVGILKTTSQSQIAGIKATNRSVMARDYYDVISSDALLVNLTAPGISGGTMAELAWAYHLRIPTVVICPAKCYYTEHPMAAEMIDFRVDTLEEGIEVICSILLR